VTRYVARVERSETRDGERIDGAAPGFASLTRATNRVICPTGKSCQAPFEKIFWFSEYPNHFYIYSCPAPRGALAIVTDVGQDAVDADGVTDENTRSRTAKSCGPDASTLASSFRGVTRLSDGDKQARSPGRARRKPLKPLRAGMPGNSGELVATTTGEHFYPFLPTRLRVHWAPGIPHALFGRK
jgi:hypothetical protein